MLKPDMVCAYNLSSAGCWDREALELSILKSPYRILLNIYFVEKLPCKRYKMYITDAKNILILFTDYYPSVALKTLAIMDIDANNSMEKWVAIGAGEMAYLLRELAAQSWGPKFGS